MPAPNATEKRHEAGTVLMQRLDALAECSDESGALTRLFLSPAHRRAIDRVSGWMREAGLAVSLDAAGTLIGDWPASDPDAPVLLLGSHLDTVRDAGRFDGALGVLAALDAIASLREAGVSLPFAVRLLAFGDEEGVRFPVTLTGSRALAGTLDAHTQLGAADADGITLGDALRDFGLDPAGLDRARFSGRALAFVELHIEQGPVLERLDRPLGIVSAINGAARYRIGVQGEAGHAGTVPMAGRRDALAASAEMMVAIRRIGLAHPGVTATVGRIDAFPGAVNVIPGRVLFTLDLRSPSDAVRAAAWGEIDATVERIAAEHEVGIVIERTHEAPAAPCDPALMDALFRACASVGVEAPVLPSGAGHDAMAMAALCPMAMLFVRCRGGISHNPAESIRPADAALAVRALAGFIRNFVTEGISS